MKKIVWAEGILLGSQHLQQWDKYHHAREDFLARSFTPFNTGIKKLIIDDESFARGQLIIKQLDAILPNGLIIQYDNRYDAPLSLLMEKPGAVYLAVPLTHHTKGITGYPDNTALPAWLADYVLISDEEDAEREREILFARPNIVLLREEEDRSQYNFIKILDEQPNFVPALISIEGSYWLKDILRGQIELLESKIRVLQDRRKQFRTDITDFNHSDLADFLLLQLFNQTLPELCFLRSNPQFHPHAFYQVLIKLVGGLSTFSEEVEITDYQHHNLNKTFVELDGNVKNLIEHAMPSRMSALKWVRETDTLYTVDSIDSHIFLKNSFYLAVYVDSANIEWLSKFTRQVKIGARSSIESIVASALPGVNLIHTQRPPNKLPVKAGFEYFYLEPKGQFWEQINTERTLSLFTSYDFSKAQIELVTVED